MDTPPSARLERDYIAIDMGQAQLIAPKIIDAYTKRDAETLVNTLNADLWKLTEKRVEWGFPSLRIPRKQSFVEYSKPKYELPDAHLDSLNRFILPYATRVPGLLKEIRDILDKTGDPLLTVGADLAFEPVDHWYPSSSPGNRFAGRGAANELIGLAALRKHGISGNGVHVLVVDRGLNRAEIIEKLHGKFGGGWQVCPGDGSPCSQPGELEVVKGVTDNEHGMMIARNVLAVAPAATLHDLPLLPPRITKLPQFLSDAHAAFERMLADLPTPGSNARWVVVNAWACFDRQSEVPPGDYSENRLHPFNVIIDELADRGVDVVFAAGNCGQFRPDPRCGIYDIGAGRSIFGANAHPRALTVGSVTTNGMWIGSSAQGPGPDGLASSAAERPVEKPDVAAPSMFTEEHDRHTQNGGTSAASAIAAGVVAALRERWGPNEVSPEALKMVLRKTAVRPGAAHWDERIGTGIINAEKALMELSEPS